ncbi:MAG: gamma carbonic anhydrase family protein [Cellulosilyticaceae bacterium]
MIKKFLEHIPEMDETVFIAENATVIGQVSMGTDVNIWYGAVVRGDENAILIGDQTNIQDNAVIHIGHEHATAIGKGVTIGHGAIVHGAMIGDYTLIGMGATILDGAKIGKNCIIGANSLVTGGTHIDEGMLAVGNPARMIRPLKNEEIKKLYESAAYYVALANKHRV